MKGFIPTFIIGNLETNKQTTNQSNKHYLYRVTPKLIVHSANNSVTLISNYPYYTHCELLNIMGWPG